MSMNNSEIETLEIRLLLEAIYQRYGYDFRSYARAYVQRRIRVFLASSDCDHISELISRVLRDEELFASLAQSFSITVTEMFRDPFFFRALRDDVLPVLKTWPSFKVWHAGCATGEEVYSLAILLEEEGLYESATVYGTDFNETSLSTAKEGIYELDRARQFTRSYQEAGGKRSFSEYYHAKYNSAIVVPRLKERLTFANHNLTVDRVFGEMHLVVCRNVLIYFDKELQDRVLGLFADSLVIGGFLCLGAKEGLQFSAVSGQFKEVDRKARIFKRVSGP